MILFSKDYNQVSQPAGTLSPENFSYSIRESAQSLQKPLRNGFTI